MPNKIEPAPTARASCRGCKQTIAKGDLRFAEEAPNPYSDDGGVSYRYWHLKCAAAKVANELRDALATYEGEVADRSELDELIATHARPTMPYAERAGNGRARCKGCDEGIKKGELRVAFERVFDSPMGPQKGAAYAHPGCVGRYLQRQAERTGDPLEGGAVVRGVLANSKLGAGDREEIEKLVAEAIASLPA